MQVNIYNSFETSKHLHNGMFIENIASQRNKGTTQFEVLEEDTSVIYREAMELSHP